MPKEYHSPDVYVEEVSTGANTYNAASTTTTALLGVAPKADAYVDEPRACTNWSEFVRDFMPEDSKPTNLAYAVYGYFMNGGQLLYVVNIGANGTVAGDARKGTGIHALAAYNFSMLAAPGYSAVGEWRAMLDNAEQRGDHIVILDGPSKVDDPKQLTDVAIADAPADGDAPAGGGRGRAAKNKAARPPDSKYGAYYFPHLVMPNPFGEGDVVVPPSGHMAGIYASNDADRGVHKAPANRAIKTVTGLSQRVAAPFQGVCNDAGVNIIRFFPNLGIRVWGARTLSLVEPQWKYINVRRYFIFVEQTIANSTMWTVFEPNDAVLRNSVIRDCKHFLRGQWRGGALVGATEEQAFFVKCDEENNPQESIDAGRLIIEVGLAVVKPAEFVVFRIGQMAGGPKTKE
jgi:phage tail sheath protein FI